MMEWVKISPDTMPPDMEPLIVSVRQDFGSGEIGKCVSQNVRYRTKNGWEYLVDSYNNKWSDFRNSNEITHWMKIPEPAQEDNEAFRFTEKTYNGVNIYHVRIL